MQRYLSGMSKVAVIRTTPETVLEDYERLLELVEYRRYFSGLEEVVLKLNLSWSLFFPACSTPPWQLDGVLRVLVRDGFRVYPVEDQTVVTDPWKGAYLNKWLPVFEKYGVSFTPLPNVEWVEYEPKSKLLALDKLFQGRILVPKLFIGRGVIHLATLKTHGHTVITGVVKNAFGGLIPRYRHHAHKLIHDVLVDLLQIQKEIHPRILGLIDGTVAGDGAGPRTMTPRVCNLLIAGVDQVAVDSVAARIMGFDPWKIEYLRKAHEMGLGCADVDAIDLVGDAGLREIRLNFKARRSPVVFLDQLFRKKLSRRFPLIETVLFHTPLFKLAILGSSIYHDHIWYPTVGRVRIRRFFETGWGRLWLSYPYGKYPRDTYLRRWDSY